MATITGDRSTLFTAPEVQAIIERERTVWSIALTLAIVLAFLAGGVAGVYVAAGSW
jgi:hypothetical protein